MFFLAALQTLVFELCFVSSSERMSSKDEIWHHDWRLYFNSQMQTTEKRTDRQARHKRFHTKKAPFHISTLWGVKQVEFKKAVHLKEPSKGLFRRHQTKAGASKANKVTPTALNATPPRWFQREAKLVLARFNGTRDLFSVIIYLVPFKSSDKTG